MAFPTTSVLRMAVHCVIAFPATSLYLPQDNSSHSLSSQRVPGLASYAILTTTSIVFDQFTSLKPPLLTVDSKFCQCAG